jgi:hypothetical protein
MLPSKNAANIALFFYQNTFWNIFNEEKPYTHDNFQFSIFNFQLFTYLCTAFPKPVRVMGNKETSNP